MAVVVLCFFFFFLSLRRNQEKSIGNICGSVAFLSVHITNKDGGGGGAGGSRNSSAEASCRPLVALGKAEAFGALLDGLEQHGTQLVVSLIGR